MPRLFVAINFPKVVNEQLLGLGGGVPGARWLEEDQLHLTLRFIGEVDGTMFREIREALGTIRAQSFSLQLREVSHFPPRGHPRILWVGIEKNPALVALQDRIEGCLSRMGVATDSRKFSPHITVARLKNSPSDRVGQFLMAHNLFKTEPFTVSEFHLYSSLTGAKQSVYRIEVSYPLLP